LALGGLLATLAVAATALQTRAQPAGEQVTLREVTYAELGKLVRGYKGKVLVVDFWADY
jgi:hypothetical protein